MTKMRINHISVSRENTWNECKKKYHYRYHLELIPPREPIYFLYGKIIHKIIEVYTKSMGKTNINEIIKSVLKGDILLEEAVGNKPEKKVTGPLPIAYSQKLPVHVSNFLKLIKVLGFDAKVEWKFDYDLDPPNKRLMTGLIDHIVLKPDSCLVVDYKTTKQGPWRKTPKNIHTDLQLQCYASVIQREYGYKADQITCALYFLEGAEFVPTKFTQETIDSVEKRMLKLYKEIESTDADSVIGRTGDHCYRCSYFEQCPFFNKFKL